MTAGAVGMQGQGKVQSRSSSTNWQGAGWKLGTNGAKAAKAPPFNVDPK